MGATIIRQPATSEEAKLFAIEALANLVKEMQANPDLLKKIGDEAAKSRVVTTQMAAAQEKALKDIEAGNKTLTDIDVAQKALEDYKAQLVAEHIKNKQDLDKQSVYLATRVAAHAEMVSKHFEARDTDLAKIADLRKAIDEDRKDLAARNELLDKRREELELETAQSSASAHKVLDNREAKLDKREEILNAKTKKLEELKAALKDD